jgi:hypothetical protein
MEDADYEWLDRLGLEPAEVVAAPAFLDACLTEFPGCLRYAYKEQQKLLPNILTVGAVLGAIPLDEEMDVSCPDTVFDANVEFAERNTPYLATAYVYDHFVTDTTGLAIIDPGYDKSGERPWDPEMTGDINPHLVDFVFSEKLFVTYLVNGCIPSTEEHALFNEITSVNPWPKPIGVFGYADYWHVAGSLFEAHTLCTDSRNMGAIPTGKSNNLSFFGSRRPAIRDPGEIVQNEPEDIAYDPSRTYVAFIVGDGDNISKPLRSFPEKFRQRLAACAEGEGACPTLTWSLSPHLSHLAPDLLEWYYERSHETGKDYFTLPPSGHLYGYPASMEETRMQDAFVAATEDDARLLGTQSTVDWEWFTTWAYAEEKVLTKYARRDGTIKGIFPVNVPYFLPTFTWERNQFFKILVGPDGGKVVLFRPRQWRGLDVSEEPNPLERLVQFLSWTNQTYIPPKDLASELGEYPRGTVAGVYMTGDGGLNLMNSFFELVQWLPEHVQLVSADTATKLAFEASGSNLQE